MNLAPRPKRARPTLADVAQIAGVSVMTVSAVLSGKKSTSRFSAETQQRVLEAAAELRYRPNVNARALVEGRSNAIGVVAHLLSDEPNLYFLEVLTGILAAAREHAHSVHILALESWSEAEHQIPKLCNGSVDAVVLVGPMFESAAEHWLPRALPYVSIHSNTEVPGITDIGVDEEQGAYEAVREIIRLGHRRLVHLAGPVGSVGADRRRRGFVRALEDAGLPLTTDAIVSDDYTREGGKAATARWLDSHVGQPLPDAIFCAADGIALGCLDELKQRGIAVPAQVSVVGFDDNVLARAAGLTSVRQPLPDLGREAVNQLLDEQGGVRDTYGRPWLRYLHLPTSLVKRETLIERATSPANPAAAARKAARKTTKK